MGLINAALWPLFDYVAKNRWLQIVLLCVTGLIVIRVWLWFHDEHIKKLAKEHAIQQTRKTIDKIERKADEHIEQAERIRAANPVTGDPDRMSDRPLPDYHYRD